MSHIFDINVLIPLIVRDNVNICHLVIVGIVNQTNELLTILYVSVHPLKQTVSLLDGHLCIK